MLRRLSMLAACAGLTALAACSDMTPSALMAAARLDPLDTPPGDIAVAVAVPAGLRLSTGDAVMRLAFFGEGRNAARLVEAIVPLSLQRGGVEAPTALAAGDVVYTGTLSASGASQIARAQSEIRALRAAGRDGVGSLGIEVVGGCFEGTAPDQFATTAWFRGAPDAEFVLVGGRRNLEDALGSEGARALMARIGACDA